MKVLKDPTSFRIGEPMTELLPQLDKTPSGGGARWRVLIFPGGTEIGLELRQALAWRKEVELISAGSSGSNHAPLVFRKHFVVPSVHDSGWVAALNEVVKSQCITHIFPAHDDVVLALAENAERLMARVVGSPLRTVRVARSKSATIKLLEGVIPVPLLFASLNEIREFPVFVKPDRGQGSLNAARVVNMEQLRALLLEDPSRIILEYLPGDEFTVDCFSDRERGLLYAAGRQRYRIRSGIAMDSAFVVDPRFDDYARRIAERLRFHGAWFFQLKADSRGELKLLEVAPRIAGTSALSRACGVNLPLLSLYECDRMPVEIQYSDVHFRLDRALTSRFGSTLRYHTIYVDYDDTLVVRNQVNVELIKLLFQALNRGVRLILITRHAGDLSTAMRRFRLDGLFDQVIHIKDALPKHRFMEPDGAILIDDSFAERAATSRATGMPVFDVGMVDALLDDRAGTDL